jgi:hypothetical protein
LLVPSESLARPNLVHGIDVGASGDEEGSRAVMAKGGHMKRGEQALRNNR